jgi:DNA-binding PadR family transcriptional regulator
MRQHHPHGRHDANHQLQERRFARGPFAHGDHHGRREDARSGRGGPGRLLGQGDLRPLMLHLVNNKPRHGYEIIKAIEELAGGAYSPSPGVIYPTLTLLEEMGQITSTAAGPRKSYSITEAGSEALAANQELVQAILSRIAASQPRETALPVIRALENLRTVLRLKLAAGAMRAEIIRKIADRLDEVTRAIEEM